MCLDQLKNVLSFDVFNVNFKMFKFMEIQRTVYRLLVLSLDLKLHRYRSLTKLGKGGL